MLVTLRYRLNLATFLLPAEVKQPGEGSCLVLAPKQCGILPRLQLVSSVAVRVLDVVRETLTISSYQGGGKHHAGAPISVLHSYKIFAFAS